MKFIKKLLLAIVIAIIVLISIALVTGYCYYQNAIKEKSLSARINEVTSKSNYTSFDKLTPNYVNAVVSTEDKRFFTHNGIDIIAICRSFYVNIQNKDFDEGGSTITQQVAKNLVFSQDKNIIRKLGEIFAAFDIEKNYSKNEIFAIYANSSYFGDGYYGITDASKGYYQKTPDTLNLDEASMLAGIPNAPSKYSPTVNPSLAKERQKKVLQNMVDDKYITQEEANAIK